MSQICGICSNPKRKQIEREILKGTSSRLIAEKFGVSARAVSRHRANKHILSEVIGDMKVQEIARVETLFDELARLKQDIQVLYDEARKKSDRTGALYAIDRLLKRLEVEAKVRGMMPGTQVTVNVANISGEIKNFLIVHHPDVLKELAAHLKERFDVEFS